MKRIHTVLCALVLACALSRATGQTCTRCRAFELTLSCEETDTVEPKYNGYMCAAMSGATVKLNCNLADSDNLDVVYEWYKSNTIEGKSFKDQTSGKEKIADCSTSECTLYDVKWSSDSDTDVTSHDSFFYQCIAEVKAGADDAAVFYSNALALDVQSYIEPTKLPADTHSVDTGTPELQLSCPVPVTNPPSSVVWLYTSDDADVDMKPKDVSKTDNMFVVQDTILAADAKYGYTNGMLVIMDFKPSNAGTYTCSVKFMNRFGTMSQRDVSSHAVVSSGVTKTAVSNSFMLVSQVTKPAFLFHDTDDTVFQCLGSSLVAGKTGSHTWQKAEEEDGIEVYKSLSNGRYTLSNHARTLTVPRSNSNTGVKYRCQIQKDEDTLMLNNFVQASIIPKSIYIPSSISCIKNEAQYTATSDDLMTSDVDKEGAVQVLAGSSFFWQKNGTSITKFDEGYTVSSSELGYILNTSVQCNYLQQFKYIGGLYSVQQIHAVSMFSEISTSIPSITIKKTGSETMTISCTAIVSAYPDALENKIGLSVLFDIGGCIDYTEAVVNTSSAAGICGTTVTRWMQINTKKLCTECVIKCKAATSCTASNQISTTIEPVVKTLNNTSCSVCQMTGKIKTRCENGNESTVCQFPHDKRMMTMKSSDQANNCEGTTEEVSDDELPNWGIALIVVAIIITVLGIAAIFFYTYMQKLQNESDNKILGAAILKANVNTDKLYTMPAKSFKNQEKDNQCEVLKVITLGDGSNPVVDYTNAEAMSDKSSQP